ncbi:sigma-54-dependent Fis family transcriptional regulator [Nocardia abscessus]|uniref:sigma-54-dependent Fis family transcriptional regulator n=1 Tax=Nocardia abscessus TaxID=120957 RepID=UPI002455304F|nr:helix-turn-helix domain-containing protein [Nocardia abscessus]
MACDNRDSDVDLRPEIALGWRRSKMNGLDPGMGVRESRLFEIDGRSRLLRAAEPVLRRMLDELEGTRFSILLADRRARIIDRRSSSRSMYRQLDAVKAVPGVQYVEEVSGTNSLATAFELRKPIAVAGHEHFLEALHIFCCYGSPIIHPITGRLEGILDITGPVGDRSNLLGPFLLRAIRDIEQRLQEGSRLSEQRLFTEFQKESARKKSAIMLFGENLTLTNAAAADLVRSDDYPMLRALSAELGNRSRLSHSLLLSSGHAVDVHARLVDDCREGVLIEVIPRASVTATARTEAQASARRTVLVTGGPGSGKSTRARAIAGATATTIDLAMEVDSAAQRRAKLEQALATSTAVILDDVHLCQSADTAVIRAALSNATGTVVMVFSDGDDLSAEHQALASMADEQETLPALRDAGHGFPQIVQQSIACLATSDDGDHRQLRITPSALEVLAEQDWPGNLVELRRVLTAAIRGRTHGDITVDDLPDSYRHRALRKLTPLERAERATILAVLTAAQGNKAATAAALGIGRNTLYQRLRYYQISV